MNLNVSIRGEQMKEYSEIFKALSDEGRLKILKFISGYERCACDIQDQLDLTQPTISHHMKVLCQSGIINSQKKGRWMYYSINKEKMEELNKFIQMISLSNEIIIKSKECD